MRAFAPVDTLPARPASQPSTSAWRRRWRAATIAPGALRHPLFAPPSPSPSPPPQRPPLLPTRSLSALPRALLVDDSLLAPADSRRELLPPPVPLECALGLGERQPRTPPPARRLPRTPVEAPSRGAGHPGRRGREMAVEELVDTERAYVADLHVIETVFLRPMRERRAIPERTFAAVLSSLLPIVALNTELLSVLEGGEPVGRCFLRFGDFFKVYATYVLRAERQSAAISQLRRHSPHFSRVVQECERDPACGRQQLEGFLIKPVQRICRYPLLLRTILERTPRGDADRSALECAIARLYHVCAAINQRKREDERAKELLALQPLLVALTGEPLELVRPARKFLRMGDFAVRTASPSAPPTETRCLLLFSDLLLLAARSRERNRLVVQCYAALENVSLGELPGGRSRELLGVECKAPALLLATRRERRCGGSAAAAEGPVERVLLCLSDRDRTEWLRDTAAAVAARKEALTRATPGAHDPLCVPAKRRA
eukprot:m51a1_g6470 putative domain containing protein (490) ;mRNA; f:64953-67521